MAILLLHNQSDDSLYQRTIKRITTGILSSGKKFNYFNVCDINLKLCNRDDCPDLSFDKSVRGICTNYDECINMHNNAEANLLYQGFTNAEAIIICLSDKHEFGQRHFSFSELFNRLRGIEYSSARSSNPNGGSLFAFGELRKKRCMVIVVSEEYENSLLTRKNLDSIVASCERIIRMKVIDEFLVDSNNEKYMLPVIEFAVGLFSDSYQDLKCDENAWFRHYKEKRGL